MGILAGNSIHDGGSIFYDGKDLMKIDEENFHKIRGTKIAMIFQDPMSSLNPIMKVGKQISEALVLKLGLSKKDAKARTLKLMEEVGIPEPEKRYYQYPFQYSGGMRQRIVIAIALSNDAEILICDEPTTALDVTIQAQILELINRIKAERDLSVIFITHDLGVVANMADRISVMYAGKIVETGTVDEIFYKPAHPYTWALLSSMPDLESTDKLFAIPGTPPDMHFPPVGDAFAARNKYALQIDFEKQPPMFKVSDTHYAATWLLHKDAPKVQKPEILVNRIARMEMRGNNE
jgi:oligopeptide transport system ATP-binding protein